MRIIPGARLPIHVWSDDDYEQALAQAKALAELPFIHNRVVLCADYHVGYGVPIGTVFATNGYVLVNGVGNDIGCGVAVCETAYNVDSLTPEKLQCVFDTIQQFVPTGMGNLHTEMQDWAGFSYFDKEPNVENWLNPAIANWHNWLSPNKRDWIARSLGTLGGGNHFLSLEKDDAGQIYIMVHSGSRNLGQLICSYYHSKALEFNEKWCSILPNKELAYLPINSQLGFNYVKDMNFALDYAKENRRRMMSVAKQALISCLGHPGSTNVIHTEFDVHHNYANLEHVDGKDLWVHRKGAISARDGELGIIPGSQGTASYIVKGCGNPASFYSCSHGAGRKLGRAEADRTLNEKVETDAMIGIYFKGWGTKEVKVEGKKATITSLEEAPGAYKNIEEVIKQQEHFLIDVVTRLTPIGVVKG